MNLNEEIRYVLAGLAIPEPVNRTIAEAMEQVEQNQVAPGLAIGDQAPDFTLPNPYGKLVSLHDKLEKGPVVVSFFRGDWCPVCNLQLQSLQRALPDIESAGGSLVTITPQSLRNTLSLREKAALEFDVLTDVDQSTMRDYRVQFTLPERVKDIYLGVFALDLGKQNADGSWNLPVPGTEHFDFSVTSHIQPACVKHRIGPFARLDPESQVPSVITSRIFCPHVTKPSNR